MGQEAIQNPEDIFELSDEELMNMPEPDFTEAEKEEDSEEDTSETLEADNSSEQSDETTDGDNEDNDTEIDEDTATGVGVDAEEGQEASGEDEEAGEDEEKETEASSDNEKVETISELDYKVEYEKLIAPFKANGEEIQIDNVAEAISLMQMGANYTKKMQGLRPSMKLLKMLENNKLLDEEKINHLIDLSKQNPAAINKLVKDSGIDPHEIDLDTTDEYKPNTYTVEDNEVELDSVLQDIEGTQSYKETIDIIGNKWDAPSKQILASTPALITSINDHVASGVYEKINRVMQKERMLGRLTGMSDLEAYKYVGDNLEAQGAFAPQPPTVTKDEPAPTKSKVDPKLKSRKKAASSTRTTPKSPPREYNPLDVSDDDFDKMPAPM